MAEGGSHNKRNRRKLGRETRYTGCKMYDAMLKYVACNKQLNRHGFPRPGKNPGIAKFFCNPPKEPFNDTKYKTCRRCGESFVLETSGPVKGEECVYHSGRLYDDGWTCCGQNEGIEGCTTAKTHVHMDNVLDRTGYVKTTKKSFLLGGSPGIYAIDCEMSYTVKGLEVTAISIVDKNCMIIYNRFVKPYGEILDYNTQFSGVTKEDLSGTSTTLEDVQNFILDNFSSDTILIGHSLESDFVALRLIHETVVDTSQVFPHPKGFPYKYKLKTLAKRKIDKKVQNGEHDSVEDATACMQIMLSRIGHL